MIDLETAEKSNTIVQAGDLRVHLHDVGEGPTLILLHGGGPGGSGWSNFKQNVPVLAERFRVLVIDQPGYGRTDKPEFTEPYYTLSARTVRNVLDALAIESADFVGNSLGGGTALRFALDYPDRAGKLVLMGPGGGAVNVFSPDPSEGLKVLGGFYGGDGPSLAKIEALVRVMLFDQSYVSSELVKERYEAAIAPGAREGATRALASIADPDDHNGAQLWRHLSRVRHKSLLMWGRDDRTMPLDGAFFALKQMPDAQLHVFPRCGHWAQLEHCDAFNRLVIDFLLND